MGKFYHAEGPPWVLPLGHYRASYFPWQLTILHQSLGSPPETLQSELFHCQLTITHRSLGSPPGTLQCVLYPWQLTISHQSLGSPSGTLQGVLFPLAHHITPDPRFAPWDPAKRVFYCQFPISHQFSPVSINDTFLNESCNSDLMFTADTSI